MKEPTTAVPEAESTSPSASAVGLPECVEVQTGPEPVNAVIWLHGLGADGHDFEPVVPMLGLGAQNPTRFVFPHAPVRPVTLNGGMPMRAWYDIRAIDASRDQDEQGIAHSSALINALIERELSRGIAASRIVLAGFSQGGAMAAYVGLRCVHSLAGLMVLSAYGLFSDQLASALSPANAKLPVFAGHGNQDPMVPVDMGRALARQLEALGLPVEWHEYAMPHSVVPEELADIAAWLKQRLG